MLIQSVQSSKQPMYLGGDWSGAGNGQWFEVVDPATLQEIGEVPQGGAAEARQAVEAAAVAFPGWAALSGRERARYLLQISEKMRRNTDEIARQITAEAGKPLKQARDEARSAAAYMNWYGEEAKRVYGEYIPSAQRDKRVMVIRKPVGVVAAITPWNFPLGLLVRKAAAALAVGCTVVVKPAPETPLVALAFARLCHEAGLPAGVLNVITGDAEAIGKVWLSDPRVRALSFTGSNEVGKILARQAADRLLRVSLELGGSAPYIIFDDADLEGAVAGLFKSKIRNAGQVCAAPNRIYVQSGIFDKFLATLQQMVLSVKVGNGFHPESQMGPLINEAGYRKVEQMVAEVAGQGAEVFSGGSLVGEPDTRQGWFYLPRIITNLPEDCPLMEQEAFGPVLPVLSFNTEKEVIERANRSPYGLGAYAFTCNLDRTFRLAEQLEAGIIGINDPLPAAIEAPFGGVKESGYGRESGAQGLNEFVEEKTISIQLTADPEA
jgi:succinate-semialdehyde dehydrogenase / glutarate-semialdehyde dehydrogenase